MKSVLPLSLATFVCALVFAHGLPALRHDWRVPIDARAEGPWLQTMFQPWLPQGIGTAQPYPTFFLLGFALSALEPIASSTALIAAVVFAATWLAAIGASSIVRERGGTAIGCAGAACFAALNPWVYAKLVAGHMIMVLAYGVLFALVAELSRERPRRPILLVLAAFASLQIEFIAVALAPLVWHAWRRRDLPLLVAVTAPLLPSALGLAARYGEVRSTIFNLVWQVAQSVDPTSAVWLGGYQFGYASTFATYSLAGFGFACIATIGSVAAVRSGRARTAFAWALGGAVLSILAMGVKGPLGSLYGFGVTHLQELGLFRELYDLLGLVAVVYVVLAAEALSKSHVLAAVACLAGGIYLVPWFNDPPFKHFVAARTLPDVSFVADPNVRVALNPLVQPMSFSGSGSGVDPDAYPRDGEAIPINEVEPSFPVAMALARASAGDSSDLRALAVAQTIDRPYLVSDTGALAGQRARLEKHTLVGSPDASLFLPLLGLMPGPASRSLTPGRLADLTVFFGDDAPALVSPFPPNRSSVDAATAWIDARLTVAQRPSYGSAFGGLMTSGPAPLEIPQPGRWPQILAMTTGRLQDDRGETIATPSKEPVWWRLGGAHFLRCRGECEVVLLGDVPVVPSDRRAPRRITPIQVRFATPWLAFAELSGEGGTLRFAERYSTSWTAFAAGRYLVHERLATALNGFVVPASVRGSVVLIEAVSASQFVSELLVAATLVGLVGWSWSRSGGEEGRSRPRLTAASPTPRP